MMSAFEQRCGTATLSLLFFGAAVRNDFGAWPLTLTLSVIHAIRWLRLMVVADPKERG
jgi:hypothetical protein